MKRSIFAIVILLLIVAVGVGEQIWLHSLFDDLHSQTEGILQSLAVEDQALALRQTQQLQRWWEERKHLLEAVVSHNETKEVTLRIAELKGYIAIDDIKSSYATAAILHEMATNVPHLLGFSWDTIC